ncbi:putative membrane protein [Burkholderia pseudomallei MSHR5608]|nr:putative membrane protein [Burkholderia pseudomallei MSHR5608]
MQTIGVLAVTAILIASIVAVGILIAVANAIIPRSPSRTAAQ